MQSLQLDTPTTLSWLWWVVQLLVGIVISLLWYIQKGKDEEIDDRLTKVEASQAEQSDNLDQEIAEVNRRIESTTTSLQQSINVLSNQVSALDKSIGERTSKMELEFERTTAKSREAILAAISNLKDYGNKAFAMKEDLKELERRFDARS